MKHRNIIRSIFAAVAAVATTGAWAETETVGGYTWTYRINGDTAEIYNNGSAAIAPDPTGAVTIPSSLGGIPMRIVGFGALCGCSNLTSVTIPSGVTLIEPCAFEGCNDLTSVIIGNDVTDISGRAFYGCTSLTSVIIGNGVTSIGSEAFYGCSSLTSVTIPNSVTGIGNWAFYGCSSLTSVTIPNSVTSIDGAFYGCSGLTNVTIPQVLCESKMSSAFPDSYQSITNIAISDGVTHIDSYVFAYCSGLKSVTIPDGVASIGDFAFYYCSGLTSVTIPESVMSIGSNAFDGCSGLTSVYVNDLAAWCRISFGGYGSNPIGKALNANLYVKGVLVKNLVIPDNVTSIGNWAFCGASITNLTIPSSVTNIGAYAFDYCSQLRHVSLSDSVVSFGEACFGSESYNGATHSSSKCPAYYTGLYRAIFSAGNDSYGTLSICTAVVQQVDAPYVLADHAADRAISSVTVDGDCAIDEFVLKDGKVYDSMLYVSNTADREVKLSLPTGYTYKTFKGTKPLTIPAKSQCMISITRVADKTFLVAREDLEDVK